MEGEKEDERERHYWHEFSIFLYLIEELMNHGPQTAKHGEEKSCAPIILGTCRFMCESCWDHKLNMLNILPSTAGCFSFWFTSLNSWTTKTPWVLILLNYLLYFTKQNKTLRFVEGRQPYGTFVLVLADDSTSPPLTVQPVWNSRRSGVLHQHCFHATAESVLHESSKGEAPCRRILKSSGELRIDITAPAQ